MAEAAKELAAVNDLFRLLFYTREVMQVWQRIVTAHGVSGKQTHDAHLVAIMQVNTVGNILTFNDGDFRRFPEIQVLNPAEVS